MVFLVAKIATEICPVKKSDLGCKHKYLFVGRSESPGINAETILSKQNILNTARRHNNHIMKYLC